MADSKRAVVAHHKVAENEDAQAARDRRNLIVMLVGGVIIVIGMIFLSKFLSGS